MSERLLERLAAGAEQLDEAIGRAAFGAVPDPVRHWPLRVAVAAVVLAGAALTGTVLSPRLAGEGDDGSRATGGPPVTEPVLTDVTMSDVTMSVVAAPTPDELVWAEINWAWNVGAYGTEGERLRHLIVQDRLAECMERQGFEYPQLPFVPSPADLHGVSVLPPAPSVGQVEAQGYRALLAGPGVGLVGASPEFDAAAARIAELAADPAWSAAYFGGDHSSGECMIEAWDHLEKSVGREAERRRSALDPAGRVVTGPLLDTSGRMRPLLERWSTCMLGGGFRFDDRGDVADEFHAAFAGRADAAPSEREVQVALRDLHCREVTGWYELRREIATDAIAEFRRDHAGEIAELEQLVAAENAAAERVAADLGLI